MVDEVETMLSCSKSDNDDDVFSDRENKGELI